MFKKAILTTLLVATTATTVMAAKPDAAPPTGPTYGGSATVIDYARSVAPPVSPTPTAACNTGIEMYEVAKGKLSAADKQNEFYKCRADLSGWKKKNAHEDNWFNYYFNDKKGIVGPTTRLASGELFQGRRFMEVLALHAHNMEQCAFNKAILNGDHLVVAQQKAFDTAEAAGRDLLRWIQMTIPSKVPHKRWKYVANSYHQAEVRENACNAGN